MSKINLILKALGVSTVILSSCITPTVAQTTDVEQTTNDAQTTTENLEIEKLEPSPDLLERPSTPEDVTIDLTEPITLEQAVELSLRNNRDLQESKLNLERSTQELREARAALFPQLDLQSQFTRSNTASNARSNERSRQRRPGQTDEQIGIQEDTSTVDGDLTLTYDIYTGGRRGADIRRAEQQVEFDSLDVERVTEQVLFETISDYYDLQDADAQVRIREAAVEDAAQTLKDARLLEQAGLGTRFDVLRAEVELANAEQELTRALANQKTARRQLVRTLSLGQQVDLRTADEIETAGVWEPSLEESIILGYDNRVELEQFLVSREINKEIKQIRLSDIRPQLSIFGTYDFLEVTDDGIDIQDGYRVGAQVQWRLFDGGRARARARQSEIDIQNDEVGFADQRNQVRLEIEDAFFNLQANKQNIATAETAVELAEESLRLARLRFQAGVGTQTDVIASQTELTTARGNLLTAVIDYNQSLNALLRATNRLVDQRLTSKTTN